MNCSADVAAMEHGHRKKTGADDPKSGDNPATGFKAASALVGVSMLVMLAVCNAAAAAMMMAGAGGSKGPSLALCAGTHLPLARAVATTACVSE
jgi:hypothetical protein